MSEEPAVLHSVDDRGIAQITLNRGDERNAMSGALLEAFAAAVDRVQSDRSVRVVIVNARGKHFCAGADLRNGVAALAADSADEAGGLRRALRAVYTPFLRVLEIEVPTIAAVRGAAIGGGFGLALACDLRIAADDARLQANFVRLGLPPGMALSALIPRAVGAQRAAELMFTGRAVSGREAAEIGLVLKSVPLANLEEEALTMAVTIAEGAPEAMRLTKRALRSAMAFDRDAVAAAESIAQASCATTDDAREGVLAWFEKRTPVFRGR